MAGAYGALMVLHPDMVHLFLPDQPLHKLLQELLVLYSGDPKAFKSFFGLLQTTALACSGLNGPQAILADSMALDFTGAGAVTAGTTAGSHAVGRARESTLVASPEGGLPDAKRRAARAAWYCWKSSEQQ